MARAAGVDQPCLSTCIPPTLMRLVIFTTRLLPPPGPATSREPHLRPALGPTEYYYQTNPCSACRRCYHRTCTPWPTRPASFCHLELPVFQPQLPQSLLVSSIGVKPSINPAFSPSTLRPPELHWSVASVASVTVEA